VDPRVDSADENNNNKHKRATPDDDEGLPSPPRGARQQKLRSRLKFCSKK
jgi:hypothetical protein